MHTLLLPYPITGAWAIFIDGKEWILPSGSFHCKIIMPWRIQFLHESNNITNICNYYIIRRNHRSDSVKRKRPVKVCGSCVGTEFHGWDFVKATSSVENSLTPQSSFVVTPKKQVAVDWRLLVKSVITTSCEVLAQCVLLKDDILLLRYYLSNSKYSAICKLPVVMDVPPRYNLYFCPDTHSFHAGQTILWEMTWI